MRRLFTVRAEEPLKLAVLDRDQLEQVLSSDPSNRLVVREKTLKRYISYLQALKKIKHFFKVSRNNEWWEETRSTFVKPINRLVEEWLDLVVDIESRKKLPSYPFFMQQQVRSQRGVQGLQSAPREAQEEALRDGPRVQCGWCAAGAAVPIQRHLLQAEGPESGANSEKQPRRPPRAIRKTGLARRPARVQEPRIDAGGPGGTIRVRPGLCGRP